MKKVVGFLLVLTMIFSFSYVVGAIGFKDNLHGKPEIIEKRDKHSKHYLNSDGSITAVIHQTPIHYKKNGKWTDINSKFVAKKGLDYDYAMTENDFHLYFSKVSSKPQKFSIGDAWISFQPLDGHPAKGDFDGNRVVYESVWQNSDLEYISTNIGLKENVILNTPDHPAQFSFKINLHGLTYEQNADGSIFFKDIDGNIKVVIPRAIMEDANGEYSDKIEMPIKKQGNHLILTLIPDQEWLKDENRVYPVKVDPSLKFNSASKDAFITQYGFTSKHGTESHLELGMNHPLFSNWVTQWSMIQFDLSTIPSDAIIEHAIATLYLYKEKGGSPVNISVREVLGDWQENSVCWNNKPSYSSAYSTTKIDGVGSYEFALDKNWVKEWISGISPNYGFFLTCPSEYVSSLKYFYSKEAGIPDKSPALFVKYEGGAGIEDYWSYRSYDLGTAGVASINVFSGNLVYKDVDISVPAKGFNLNFTRTYNSINAEQNGALGYGWTFSGNSFIEVVNGGNVIILTEEDGSKHIFKKDGSKYKAPHGIDLALTYNSPNGTYIFKSPNRVEYIYSASTTKLLRKIDKYGNQITYTYDSNKRLTTISDSSSRKIRIVYSNGRISQVIDPKNRVSYYNYDSYGNLESYQDIGGHVTRYNGGTSHHLSVVTDPEGNSTYFTYFGNEIYSVRTADQQTSAKSTIFESITKDDSDNLVRVIIGVNGCKTTYTMNLEGLVSKVEIGEEPLVETTTYLYEYEDRRIKIVDDTKSKTYYEYSNSNPDEIPDLVKVTRDIGGLNYTTEYHYDSYHNVTSVKDARGNITNNNWSSDGKFLNNVTDAEYNVVSYTYYSNGQLKTVTVTPKEGEKVTTEYSYDVYGYPNIIKQPSNETEIAEIDFDYDEMGNLRFVTDANKVTTEYRYKSNEDLLEYVINPEYPTDSSKWVKYDYDRNHNLRFITYANQTGRRNIEYVYTPLNQIKEIHYPDNTSEIYEYDEYRRLIQTTYDTGDWVKYDYTVKNQLKSLQYSDGKTVEYTYDIYGNKKTMKDERGTTTYSYDKLNRLVTEQISLSHIIHAIRYDYDEVNNLISITPSAGKATIYDYNKVNKLKSVTYDGKKTSYLYDGVYNVIGTIYPDGTGDIFAYDKAGRIVSASYKNSLLAGQVGIISPSNIKPDVQYLYKYELNGNLKSMTAISSNDTYTIEYDYDKLDQLVLTRQKAGNGLVKKIEEFDYDPMGNRIWWKTNGIETTYTYDANNKLTELQKNAFGHITLTSMTYDARGNMKSKGDITYQYNAQGRLKSVSKDGSSYQFYYDGDGRRYRQNVNGQMTNYYILDQSWHTLYEIDGNGNKKSFINGLKTIGVESEGTIKYNYHDSLGSTIGVKNDSEIQSYQYGSFGGDEVVVDDFTYADSPLNHGWRVYTSADYPGTLTTVYDNTLKNQVMRIQSNYGTNFGIAYGSSTEPLNVERTDLSVKYRADNSILLYVRLLGKNGTQYYLEYHIGSDHAPYVSGPYYHIYLGSSTKDGTWRLLERDLNQDLKEGFGVEVEKVLWFCIRGGDYDLDDLKLGGQDLTGNTRKYTDEDQDGTGLYYLRNRYYDPELGRFITADTYRGDITDPLSLNRYIYVKNNPLKYIDPSGNFAIAIPILAPVITSVVEGVLTVTAAYLTCKLIDKISDAVKGDDEDEKKEEPLPPGWDETWEKRPASKSSARRKGEKTWRDPDGGEWRYHKEDQSHNPHWDYKNPGKCGRWDQVPIGDRLPMK